MKGYYEFLLKLFLLQIKKSNALDANKIKLPLRLQITKNYF